MKTPLWLVAWLFVIELVVILLLIPGDFTEKAIEKESILIEESLGNNTRTWIHDKASSWYQAAIIDSGFYDGMYSFMIPTEEQKQKSRGMEKMGHDWFVWVGSRIEAFANVMFQFFHRLALLTAWGPYMLILLVPAFYDGLMTWKIKRTNFSYASPVIHRYSVRGTTIVLIGLIIAFFVPFALNPAIIPMSMMVCCVLIGLSVGNLQKRV